RSFLRYLSDLFRILHALRQRVPFIQSQFLFELRLFQRKLRQIVIQIIQKLVYPLSGNIVHQKNPLASRVDQPLPYHGDIGVGGICLGYNPDQGPMVKTSAAVPDKIKRLVGYQYDGDYISLKIKDILSTAT